MQIEQQRKKVEKMMSRTSETYGTTPEGLTFCFIFLHPEINRKNMVQQKNIFEEILAENFPSLMKNKPIPARGLVNLK